MLTINNTLDGYLKDVEIKGNTIQDADNLADIRSVGDKVEGQELYEIPVLSCGKNLFNGEYFDGYINDTNGVGVVGNNNLYSNFIKVTPNTDYVISYNITKTTVIAEYSSDKQFIKRDIKSQKFRTGEHTYYIRFQNNFTSIDKPIFTQLEEGTVATPYEPYVEDKITILSPTPLEKVGDVRDRIIEKDGVWGVEKNINSYIVSRDDIQSRGVNGNGYNRFNINLPNIKLSSSLSIRQDIINPFTTQYCNMDELYISTQNCIAVSTDTVVVLDVSNPTLESFRKKIVDNKFVYLLDTPTFIPLPHDQQVKLRTFANKTNISFLTEIEGTIKAQVPKSIGATVNTHTTQISNLNKELDRVKKLEESTVSTVTTESDFTVVEATSNGYFDDLKIEGKTLVNLWDINKIEKSGQTTITSNRIYINTTTNVYSNFFHKNKEVFKPSTEYTFIIDVYKNTLPTNNYIFITSYGGSDATGRDIFSSGNHLMINGGVVGRIISKQTSISDFDLAAYSIRSFVGNHGGTEGCEVELTITVLEGDHTQNPPSYFEGLMSVGEDVDEIVVSSVNENLFDVDKHNTLRQVNDYIEVTSYTNHFIEYSLLPNTDYTLSFDKYNNDACWVAVAVAGYDTVNNSNMNFHKTYRTDINGILQISIRANTSDNIGHKIKNVMLIQGTTPKLYTPHQADKKRLLFYNTETQTWEKPVLREWDSIEKHADGKYYYHQRSGEVVLNGSEDWFKTSSPNTTVTRYRMNLVDKPINTDKDNTLCNILPCKTFNALYQGDNIGVCVYTSATSSSDNYVYINSEISELDGFKQWLQTNNVTVVYQLAEEKVYECTNIDLITYSGETNYIVECGAIVPRTTLKVHNNISNVVSLLQKKVSLLESNMTKYMITQNRMQLASTYSADSVTFKVDYALCSEEVESYNEDLYNLILNNILVGKDNYDYDKMFTMVLDYASWNQISWEQFDILVGLMDMQHNPPIEEIPTDDEIVEEIPNEIM